VAVRFHPISPWGESQLRFAVPARIALQGGERASAVAISAICPLPQATSAQFVSRVQSRLSLPSARGERTPGPVWAGILSPWPTDQPGSVSLPSPAVRTISPSRHTERDVLAEPFNNIKKPGRGQRFTPSLWNFTKRRLLFSPNDAAPDQGTAKTPPFNTVLVLTGEGCVACITPRLLCTIWADQVTFVPEGGDAGKPVKAERSGNATVVVPFW
jgi:hypothetical protein